MVTSKLLSSWGENASFSKFKIPRMSQILVSPMILRISFYLPIFEVYEMRHFLRTQDILIPLSFTCLVQNCIHVAQTGKMRSDT